MVQSAIALADCELASPAVLAAVPGAGDDLLKLFSSVPDGRSGQGRDHPVASVLALAAAVEAQAALADVGVTIRDLGVLRVIARGEAQSQQEAAAVLGVDRTSMVALLDALERQGIVARRPSEQDRRRNIIALTDHGWEVFRQAESRYSETERDFTATLGDAGAAGLRQALRTVLSENGHA